MLEVMRASSHAHHLERMRDDPERRVLRDPAHVRQLEAYQDEVDRMLGRTGARGIPARERSLMVARHRALLVVMNAGDNARTAPRSPARPASPVCWPRSLLDAGAHHAGAGRCAAHQVEPAHHTAPAQGTQR